MCAAITDMSMIPPEIWEKLGEMNKHLMAGITEHIGMVHNENVFAWEYRPPVYRGKPGNHWKWMRYRLMSGLNLQQAIKETMAWIENNGTTLEGYKRKYSDGTANGDTKAERIHKADHDFLNKLVRLGIMEHAGHDIDTALAWSIMGRHLNQDTSENYYTAPAVQGDI